MSIHMSIRTACCLIDVWFSNVKMRYLADEEGAVAAAPLRFLTDLFHGVRPSDFIGSLSTHHPTSRHAHQPNHAAEPKTYISAPSHDAALRVTAKAVGFGVTPSPAVALRFAFSVSIR